MRRFLLNRRAIFAGLLTGFALLSPRDGFALKPKGKDAMFEKSGIRVSVGRPEGLNVEVDGVPFLRGSTFYVVKPNWVERYYGYQDDYGITDRTTVEERKDGSVALSITLRNLEGNFSGRQVLELGPGRRMKLSVDAMLTTSGEALVEHRLGKLYPGWVMGRAFEAKMFDGSTTRALAPLVVQSEKLQESILVERFRRLKLDSRFGPFEVVTSGTVRFSLVDYRANRHSEGEKYYWFGVLESPVTPFETLSYSMEILFPPVLTGDRSPANIIAASVTETTSVLAAEAIPDLVIPTPKCLEWGSGDMILAEDGQIRLAAKNDAALRQLRNLANEMAEDIARDYGIRLKPVDATEAGAHQDVAGGLTIDLAGTESPQIHPEGYKIRVGESARLEADTTAGVVAGLKTLAQLVRIRDGKLALRACTVEDYPSMAIRGIHCFSGKDARDLQVRMVRDIMGALKINMLIYQCEYIKWACEPSIHHLLFGMEKADAKAVLDEARRQHVEVVPLINTFGHSEWLLDNDTYRDLSDNPGMPYAYDPSNPKVYEVCERIYREAIRFFQPRSVHIGHDEITLSGFPFRPQNRELGPTELIVRDILHYHRFLEGLGVRTMMWGDMLIAPGDAPDATLAASREVAIARRARLPKDIMITDWHYDSAPVAAFRSLRVFNEDGFDAVGCTWYDPNNIVRFARAARVQHDATRKAQSSGDEKQSGQTLGLVQTTWAGYSFDQNSFDANFDQYAAYLLAAEAAWTGGYESADEVGFDFRREFARLWTRRDLPPRGADGWICDISKAASFPLKEGKDGMWLGAEGWSGMTGFPHGNQSLGRFQFLFPGESGDPKALLLASQFNPVGQWPDNVELRLGALADSLVFAVAATLPGPSDIAIAQTVVKYADGSVERIDWKVYRNVFPVEDPRPGAYSPVLWENAAAGKMPCVVHGYVWKNPHPSKRIADLKFVSNRKGSGLLVFGVSGLTQTARK